MQTQIYCLPVHLSTAVIFKLNRTKKYEEEKRNEKEDTRYTMYDAMGEIMDSGYRNPGIALSLNNNKSTAKLEIYLKTMLNYNKRNKNVSFYNKTGWNNAGRLKPDLNSSYSSRFFLATKTKGYISICTWVITLKAFPAGLQV